MIIYVWNKQPSTPLLACLHAYVLKFLLFFFTFIPQIITEREISLSITVEDQEAVALTFTNTATVDSVLTKIKSAGLVKKPNPKIFVRTHSETNAFSICRPVPLHLLHLMLIW